MKKIKVALVHNIISPYRIPLFNEISKIENINLVVYFLNETAGNRKWDANYYKKQIKFKYKILPRLKITFPFSDPIDFNINPSIFRELKKEKFDIVISAGWVDLACQLIPFLSKYFNYKYVLWAGSTKNEPSLQRKITKQMVKMIVKRAEYIISYGTKSKEYLVSLGARKESVFLAFNPIDVNFFRKKSKTTKFKFKNDIKKKYNINDKKIVILYVGQFIKRKNVDILIKAISEINNKNITLLLQGHGNLLNYYSELASSLKVDLKILHHAKNDSLPKIYGASDLFVLPSREEVWGLVINEAMACGLPVIVSDKAGCAPDLVKEGKNGFLFNSNESNDLAKKIIEILNNKKKKKIMGQNSLKMIQEKDQFAAASVFKKVIQLLEK